MSNEIIALPNTTPVDTEIDQKGDINHVDGMAGLKEDFRDIANAGEVFEHSMTVWQAVKYHKKAVLWSGVISLTIVMEAFDTSMGGQFSMFQFRKAMGTPTGDGDYQVSAQWQAAIGIAPTLGQWFGLPLGAVLVDRYGYRKAIIFNLLLITPLIAILSFAQNKTMILIGSIACGVPWGGFQQLSEAYASEVAPLTLRAYLTGWINFCWTFGGLIASGVVQGTQGIPSNWAWRIPYMTQWIWPIPLIIVMYLAPESPWWQVRQKRYDEAKISIQRLAAPAERNRVDETLAKMIRTTEFEQEQAKTRNLGGWRELVQGVNLRRTEIGCMAWACQNLTGCIFTSNQTYVLEQAGLSQTAAFRFGFGSNVITLAGNVLALYLFARVGRRVIYITGQSILCVGLLLIGGMGVAIKRGHRGAMWGQAVIQVLWNFGFTTFMGPPCYAIVGEASSTRLRNKSISVARLAYFCLSIPFGILVPYMINPTAWNWAGVAGFFWAPICAIGLVWSIFRLPEFKGRSWYDLDIMFARKVPTRQFKNYVIGPHDDEHELEAVAVA